MSAHIRTLTTLLLLATGAVSHAESNPVNGNGSTQATRPAPLISAEPSTSPGVRASTTQPADGAVTQALVRLYQIPRPQPGQAGNSKANPNVNPRLINRPPYWRENLGSNSGPRTPPPENSRMGNQHSDAIRDSVSELPIDDDLNRSGGTGQIVQNPRKGPVVARQDTLTANWSPEIEYPAGSNVPGGYVYAPGDYYRFGFWDRRYDRSQFRAEGEARRQSVLSHAGGQMSRGLQAFRGGEYRMAAKYFKLTAEQNQGDPASRLYAAHALFAIGRYTEGVEYLRRAFSLEPRIALLTFDIREDYGNKTDFDKQLAELNRAAVAAPNSLDRLLMLGYVLNYSNQPDAAYRALSNARKIDPKDKLVQTLYESTSPPDIAAEPKAGASK